MLAEPSSGGIWKARAHHLSFGSHHCMKNNLQARVYVSKNPTSGRWSLTDRIVQSERGRGWIGGDGLCVLITPARVVAVIAKALTMYPVFVVLFHELAYLLITIIL